MSTQPQKEPPWCGPTPAGTDDSRAAALKTITAAKEPIKTEGALSRFVTPGEAFMKALNRVINLTYLGPDQVRDSLFRAFAAFPALHEVPRQQLAEGVFALAELGLRLQRDAHLVISASESGLRSCAPRPTIDCLCRVARRSPDVTGFQSGVVRSDETYLVMRGTEIRLEHEPTGISPEIKAAWALVNLDGKQPILEVINEADAAEIRDGSPRPELWDEAPRRLWRAAAIRRVASSLESDELSAVLDLYHDSFRITPDPDLDRVATPAGQSVAAAILDNATKRAAA